MTFVRDNRTGAIINKDDSYYKMILTNRKDKENAKMLMKKIDTLECELTEIRDLFKQVINGMNYGQTNSQR